MGSISKIKAAHTLHRVKDTVRDTGIHIADHLYLHLGITTATA